MRFAPLTAAIALVLVWCTSALAQDVSGVTVGGLSQLAQTGVVGAIAVLAIGGMLALFLRLEAANRMHAAEVKALNDAHSKEMAERLHQTTIAMASLGPQVAAMVRILEESKQ